MRRRFVQVTPQGIVLIETSNTGVSTVGHGMTDQAELDVTDAQWADIHKQVKTGAFDFDTVKKKHGVTKEPK